eukprot:m.621215 g.621215  ORF g.621215 m.621215 type:complete len:667 (-) comp58212_c0_seq8:173-2173(-)
METVRVGRGFERLLLVLLVGALLFLSLTLLIFIPLAQSPAKQLSREREMEGLPVGDMAARVVGKHQETAFSAPETDRLRPTMKQRPAFHQSESRLLDDQQDSKRPPPLPGRNRPTSVEIPETLPHDEAKFETDRNSAAEKHQDAQPDKPVAAAPETAPPASLVDAKLNAEAADRTLRPAGAAEARHMRNVLRVRPNTVLRDYSSAESKARQRYVKEMMKRAWSAYKASAWGDNELKPVSKTGFDSRIFGGQRMGATIVDGLDTLLVMNLTQEAQEAIQWITTDLNFDKHAVVSVFEVSIRFLGGLLSAYALTGDEKIKEHAYDLGKRLLPAFETPTGIPLASVDLKSGAAKNWGWAAGRCSVLAEFGTMQLEFDYLSSITGDQRFADKVARVMKFTVDHRQSDGLYPNFMNPETGAWCNQAISIGSLGDSFYEYLLKYHIFTGGHLQGVQAASRKPFDDAIAAMSKVMFKKSEPSGLLYIGEKKGASVGNQMEHLACFAGGLLALASLKSDTQPTSAWYLESGAAITKTCHQGYKRSKTGIGPERMMFSGSIEGGHSSPRDRFYILRPETFESYFYLWRLTHEQKYRDWAWEAVQAIELHCRCGDGYCGIKDVDVVPAAQDDVQQTFFLAESLKYLYLIFAEDNVISLDQWVFNTEAHPLPILGAW